MLDKLFPNAHLVCAGRKDCIYIVRTSFDSNPKQGWAQAQKARTMNLLKAGEKASLNIRKKYWLIVLKGRNYSCTNTKSLFGYALMVWSIIWNSFFLLLSFFHLLLFFFSFSFFWFFFFFFLNPFSCYILWFLHPFLHPRVSQVLGVFLSHFAPPWTFYS